MKKKRKNKRKRGFTLLELLAIIIILGIIVTIAYPSVNNAIQTSINQANIRNVDNHIKQINNKMKNLELDDETFEGIYKFNEFEFEEYPSSDKIRCANYSVSSSEVVGASGCVIKDKLYCFNNGKAGECSYPYGQTGDLLWEYDRDINTLRISGKGAMTDYTSIDLPPWYEYKDEIKSIELGEDVTKIGNYAFNNLAYVTYFRIDSKSIDALSFDSANGNNGTNFATNNIGTKGTGIKLVFGPLVTKTPRMLLKPDATTADQAYVTSVEFEGDKVKMLSEYSLSYIDMGALKIPQSITTVASVSVGKTNKLVFFVGGDKVTNYAGWVFHVDSKLEKVVLGDSISTIKDSTFRGCSKLKTLVIPHIKTTSNAGKDTFNGISIDVDVYGDSSVKTWLDAINSASGKTNIHYHPIDEYKITIRSNTGIYEEVSYNSSYSFETSKKVDIKMYYDASDGKRYEVDADYTKEGNKYTITGIKSDVYIEIK